LDLSTVVGIIAGLGLVIWGMSSNGSLLWFWDLSSFLIVIGGTVSATFVSFPLNKVFATFNVVKKAFSTNQLDPGNIIGKIIELANVARREGLLALEEAVEQIDDSFLKKGVMLIVDGTDPELVKNILETELSFLEEMNLPDNSVALYNFKPSLQILYSISRGQIIPTLISE